MRRRTSKLPTIILLNLHKSISEYVRKELKVKRGGSYYVHRQSLYIAHGASFVHLARLAHTSVCADLWDFDGQQARMQMDRSKACQQVSCALSGIMSEPDGKSNFQQTPSRHFDAMWLTATEQLHVNTKYGSLDS